MSLVLAVNTTLAMWGQIAAIVILLFLFVTVLLMLVFNFAVVFVMAWLRQKADLLKVLRPAIDSLNKTTQEATNGNPPSEDANTIVRAVATIPRSVQEADKKIDAVTDRVAHAVIEFRARTLQAKTVVKAFFLPGLTRPRAALKPAPGVDEQGLEFKSPGYRVLVEEKSSAIPIVEGGAYHISDPPRENVPTH